VDDSSSSSDEEHDGSDDEMRYRVGADEDEIWTGLPQEEKILEMLEKVLLREYGQGILPFYTIDFFKHRLSETLVD
jgi:hypothetical protein